MLLSHCIKFINFMFFVLIFKNCLLVFCALAALFKHLLARQHSQFVSKKKMFKNCFAPLNIKKPLNLKCAEVICQDADTYFIVCTRCELKLFDFLDFIVHFRNVHYASNQNTNTSLVHNDDYEDLEFAEDDSSMLDVKVEMLDEYEVSIFKNRNKSYKQKPASPLPLPAPPEAATQLEAEAQQVFSNLYNYESNDNEMQSESESEAELELEDSLKEKPKDIKILKQQKYACKICNKSFGHPRTLKRHINTKHLRPMNFKCSHCEEEFTQAHDLKNHERDTHVGYICHLCGKVCKTRRTLSSHADTHKTTRNFVCTVENCGKSFVSSRRLSRHQLCHTGEAKYVCEQCGFRTKRKGSLALHKHMHTGEKPYECPICNKRFSTVSMRNDHVPIHSNARPYACDICGATFSRPKTLYHHKPIHLAVKKFVCKICGKAYAQMAGLSSHMRTHRKDTQIGVEPK